MPIKEEDDYNKYLTRINNTLSKIAKLEREAFSEYPLLQDTYEIFCLVDTQYKQTLKQRFLNTFDKKVLEGVRIRPDGRELKKEDNPKVYSPEAQFDESYNHILKNLENHQGFQNLKTKVNELFAEIRGCPVETLPILTIKHSLEKM